MDLKVTQKEDGITLYEGQETAQDYSNYSTIPTWIMKHPDLQANDKLVYALINTFNVNNKPFFGSNGFIAASLNLSIATVKRSIRSLEQAKLVSRKLGEHSRQGILLVDHVRPGGGSPVTQGGVIDDPGVGHVRPTTKLYTNKDTNKDTIYTKKYFQEHSDKILQEVKAEYSSNPLYKNKDFGRVLQEFLDGIEIKDYKYKNYRLAYLKWLRNSRYIKEDTPVTSKSSDFYKINF